VEESLDAGVVTPAVGRPADDAPEGYAEWLVELKRRVRATQFQALRAANAEIIQLYWSVGRDILERQHRLGWGAGVLQRLSADLRREFPGQQGWSPRNVQYMRAMALAWAGEGSNVPRSVAHLPWGHIRLLLDRLDRRDERDWYAVRAQEEGWSLPILRLQIDTDLRHRLGSAPSNFAQTLPSPDSDLAQGLTKDPVVFQHLGLTGPMNEQALEDALMDRIQDTLLELGRGMALVGRQVRITADGKNQWIDLLLFHTEQLRYIVIELKISEFETGFVGQLGSYVVAVDDLLRRSEIHAPTVGILLCQGKNEAWVRYALASASAPLAVADWRMLPVDARAALPSAEELQAVVNDELAIQRAAFEASRGDDRSRMVRDGRRQP
jgi:predicted nuclease of restriction endonuclease-like (RecB) superfamily